MADKTFQLSKCYLDCVTAGGDAIIAYAADLHWGAIHVRCASILCAPVNAAPSTTVSLRPFEFPNADSTGIMWEHPSLDFCGHWSIRAPAIQRDLFTEPRGGVTWNCLTHHAQAQVRCGTRSVVGLGYVERLHLTLEPWRLPIDVLRWGRFVSSTDSLVWIQWRGSHPLDLLFHNGLAVSPATQINTRQLIAPGLALELSPPRTLRDGSLLTTALSSLQKLAALLPVSILQTTETKWLSKATLKTAAGASTGHAIHELVTFPRG